MIQKFILPLLALVGIAFAVGEVAQSEKATPPAPVSVSLPESPYPSFVAASGLVEASSENISVGSETAGIVSKVFVRIGDLVRAGDPLFEIDGRSVRAQLETRKAALKVAQAEAANTQYDLGIAEQLDSKGVSAASDLQEKRFADAKAQAQVAQAAADLRATETTLEILTVRAPVSGQILQLKVHSGELTPDSASSSGIPLLLLGSISPLNVRAEVDEFDAWKVHSGASAVGFLRGNPSIKVPLTFVRFEPYVVPKSSLTGSGTERVDTRVLQVIYSFERGSLPIFVGQQMDVFIQASPEIPSGALAPQRK